MSEKKPTSSQVKELTNIIDWINEKLAKATKRLEASKTEFLEKFERNPAEAIAWEACHLGRKQYEYEHWTRISVAVGTDRDMMKDSENTELRLAAWKDQPRYYLRELQDQSQGILNGSTSASRRLVETTELQAISQVCEELQKVTPEALHRAKLRRIERQGLCG